MLATQDADALLDLDADCICYTANSDLRPDGVIDDIGRMLASGKNVVNTSYVPLLYPPAAGEGVAEKLQAACLEGGTSFYTSGIDPGFGNAGLAIHALALCKEVRKVRMMEIVNYDTWDNPFTMFEIMGFGKQDPSQSLLLSPGLHRPRLGSGAAPGRVGDRPAARRGAGDARDPPRRRGLRDRVRPDREGDDLRHALRDHRHGRRRGAHRRGARHPPPRRRRARVAAGAVATGSSSRASPT